MERARLARLPDGRCARVFVRPGPPRARTLVVLPPLAGDARLRTTFRRAIARSHTVLEVDLPAPERPRDATTHAFADDVRAALDALGIARFDLFGLSLGAMVATHLAAGAGPRVEHLILASCPPRGLRIGPDALPPLARLASCLVRPAALREACLVTRILSPAFCVRAPRTVARIVRVARAHPLDATDLAARLHAAATHDARDALSRIVSPTLVLRGDDDPLVSARAARLLARRLAHGSLATVARAGHDLTLERPLATAARVREFLRTG